MPVPELPWVLLATRCPLQKMVSITTLGLPCLVERSVVALLRTASVCLTRKPMPLLQVAVLQALPELQALAVLRYRAWLLDYNQSHLLQHLRPLSNLPQIGHRPLVLSYHDLVDLAFDV